MGGPVVETERLRLRPHQVGDFPALAQTWADPEVVRFISGVPSTEEASWARLLRYMGHWQALGFGYWAVTLKAEGTYVGDAGFADFRRDITPPLNHVPEAGWVLASQFHGQGYGREAVEAIHRWAQDHTTWERSCCLFDPEHLVSQNLALKVGYVPRAELGRYNGQPVRMMFRSYDRPVTG
ncbi:GNAT family N-acetyltransferase [Arenibacterium sp. LLYu02]|uniref:GNAT family N-acetyltransferase n=1 Tax=Arenibacterium sp. LLYu02 TaxID=3404132 RepID=UPI003B223436